jgi:inorganic pyrophosphatase
MKSSPTLYKAHPWHGIPSGPDSPQIVTCFIEILPTDVVKYEIDKESGHLKIDRPQKYSNQVPCLYGFVPQTYCGDGVGALCGNKVGRTGITGDGDPLDICVFSERPIHQNGILLSARPIGGFRLIDRNEADDKIISVLKDDGAYGHWHDITDCPAGLIDRLTHYFLTYKQMPGEQRKVEIAGVYGAKEAHEVIRQSEVDYRSSFSTTTSP